MPTFNYCPQKNYMGQLDIEDLGNCAIHIMATSSITKSMDEYYLVISTGHGKTVVLQYGPKHIDIDELPGKVMLTYQSFEYNANKIAKCISSFLSDSPVKMVSAAETVTDEVAYEACRKLVELMISNNKEESANDTDSDD